MFSRDTLLNLETKIPIWSSLSGSIEDPRRETQNVKTRQSETDFRKAIKLSRYPWKNRIYNYFAMLLQTLTVNKW